MITMHPLQLPIFHDNYRKIVMQYLNLIIIICILNTNIVHSQSFIYNPLAESDSWGIISFLEYPDHYLITSNEYNIIRDSAHCKLTKLSKAGIWIDESIYELSRYSRSEYFTSVKDSNFLTILGLEEDKSTNRFYEISLTEGKIKEYPINVRIDITANDILNLGDSAYLFAIWDIQNQLPRLVKIYRNNNELTFSRVLRAGPSDLKLNLDSTKIIIKGLEEIDLMNLTLDSLVGNFISTKYGKYVGDILPLGNSNSYLNTGGQIIDINIHDNRDTTQFGICILNSDFSIMKNLTFGRSGDTVEIPARVQSIAPTNNGFYFGGTSNFSVYTYPYGHTPSWFLIVKTDSMLNVGWEKYYGGDAYYFMTGIVATSDGGCIAYGTKQDTSMGNFNRDAFLIKFDRDGVINFTHEIPIKEQWISIYPNPAHDFIKIRFLESKHTGSLSFFDVSGKEIEKIELNAGQIEHIVSIKNWPRGVYLYKFLSTDKFYNNSGKLVIN